MHRLFHALNTKSDLRRLAMLAALLAWPLSSDAVSPHSDPLEGRTEGMSPRRYITSEKAPKPIGPYSQAVVAGGLVFLSGQIAINPETNELVTGPVEAQTEQVIQNILAVLKEAKLGPENVVKATVYLADLADFPAMNKVYGTHFGQPSPARSTVGVTALPKGARVEIDVIAVH